MKPGDKVFRVVLNGKGEPELFMRIIKAIQKDHMIQFAVNDDEVTAGAWNYRQIVSSASCSLNPMDAAMDYLQRCNEDLQKAREVVETCERNVDAARVFAAKKWDEEGKSVA